MMAFLLQDNFDAFVLFILFELLAGIVALVLGNKRMYKKNKVKLGLSPLKYTCTVIITYAILAAATLVVFYQLGWLD